MPSVKLKDGEMVLTGYLPRQADMMMLEMGESLPVSVQALDKRAITDKQRKFIFSLCRDIAYYTGDDHEYIRMVMQNYNAALHDIEVVSLSKASTSYASRLIDTIINYAIEKSIPLTGVREYGYNFDAKQTYTMILSRTCVICGQRADIHHVDSVGMGHNRRKINHVGKKVIPLCRQHHNEAHTIGDSRLITRYNLSPVEVDEKLNYAIKKGRLHIYDQERQSMQDDS